MGRDGNFCETYLITGAAGYIGSMLVKELLKRKNKLKIVACVRNVTAAKNIFPAEVMIINSDITSGKFVDDILSSVENIDYIIHTASPTESKFMVTNPVETVEAIVSGTRNVLELARRAKVKSMIYLSSMEVYGQVNDIGRARNEAELGDINLRSLRSSYPLGKRLAEHYCYLYCQEYEVPVKIARLAQTFGRGVRLTDNRVYMQFARAVVNETDIILRTQGKSLGNYCSIDDVLSAVLLLLKEGTDGEVYNVVNEQNTMTIREMAELVAGDLAGGKIKVKVEEMDSSKTGYPPDTGLRLSGEKLRALGWKATKTLKNMYEDVLLRLKMETVE